MLTVMTGLCCLWGSGVGCGPEPRAPTALYRACPRDTWHLAAGSLTPSDVGSSGLSLQVGTSELQWLCPSCGIELLHPGFVIYFSSFLRPQKTSPECN